MRQERRSFCRETPEQRREDLISATLEVISAGGAKAASVRNIAAQANVTMGLIRHYFSSKEDLINAAYEVYLTRIIDLAMSPDQLIELPARVRLRKLIEANFTEPVLLPQSMTLWVAFIEMTGQIPEMARIYARIYTEARSRLERLIGEVLSEAGREPAPEECLTMAIACNAVINGLWIEAVRMPPAPEENMYAPVGLVAISSIVGVDLCAPDGQ